MLDEGIDVPDANLGVVMSASRTRRQMIQRMGRILRRKRPGVAARFVIMFAKDTLEDPANRIERDGFLDEIERISEATGVFDSTRFERARRVSRRARPEVVPEPEHLERYERAAAAGADSASARRRHGRRARRHARRRDRVRAAELPAAISRPARRRDPPARRAAPAARRTRRRTSSSSSPSCPQIAKPKVEPKRLSTGQVPLEIARVGDAWRISCTGCGEASPLVQFRWQVLDQTVACRCD